MIWIKSNDDELAVDHTLSSKLPEDVGVPEEFDQNIFDVFDEYNEEEKSDVKVWNDQEG